MIKEVVQALNDQLNMELYSAYIYQAMAAQFHSEGREGFANWFDAQAREELEHARKIYDHLNERGERVELEAVDKPPFSWDSVLDAFQDALEHEKKVTESINNLVALARENDDYATESFLQWFVDEQVEEEDSVGAIVEKLERLDETGLMVLDRELSERQ